MKSIEIVGLGEVVVDWVTEIPYFPRPDEKIDAISENYFSGGVTANYVVATSRLGAKSGFIGAVGSDNHGTFLINDFNKENVDTTCTIVKKDKKTPVNFIFIAKGEKTIIQSTLMKSTKLLSSELNEQYIASAKLLHTTLIHPKLSMTAINMAKKHDVKVSIDLEAQIAYRGWENLKDALLNCDVLIPNKEGAKQITNTDSVKEAGELLVKKGISRVIITIGKQGALLFTNKENTLIPAYHVRNVIDTTGAGDAFNGAFSVGYWIKGWGIEKSCRFANAAAALKVKKLGARTGMATEKDVFNFLEDVNDPYF
ncbi:MAG: hypothetical protein GF353_26725 [Candidatus Lokiarchaeota archaeon]|nr:hypothetical protein [Candidatus Lokiarchaeota archaeon]